MESQGLGSDPPGTQRVFYALWPDDNVRAGLALAARQMHRRLHGRRTRDENLHLTLAFVGNVDGDDFERLRAVPASIATGSFDLVLDTWNCWPRQRIGWAGPASTPPQLEILANNLAQWLGGLGFQLDKRKFAPHVTLLRDAQYAAMPEALQPIHWPVREFVLVRSQRLPRGSQYEVVARWPLRQS